MPRRRTVAFGALAVVFLIGTAAVLSVNPLLRLSQAALNNGHCRTGVALLRPLAELGVVRAQYGYALVLTFGCGDMPPNPLKALVWLRRAGDNGHVRAQTDAAIALRYSYIPELTDTDTARHEEANKRFKAAAEANEPEAQFFHGVEVWGLGTSSRDPKERAALRTTGQNWIQRSADQSYARALAWLGELANDGRATSASETALAAARLRLAALQDIGSSVQRGAIASLKELEASGRGPWRSKAQFAALMEEVANRGDANAQLYLADLYETGDGVPQDTAMAVRWLSEAAKGECQGLDECESDYVPGVTAMYRMANRFLQGDGVTQDRRQAVELLTKAAMLSHPDAQLLLGEIYRDGRILEADHVQAYFWLSRAAKSDSRLSDDEKRQNATHKRDAIRKLMSPVEIADAEKLLAQ